MGAKIDVLFITYVHAFRGMGEASVNAPFWLKVHDQMATVPVLRALASEGNNPSALARLAKETAIQRIPPVLTPIYLQDFVTRRGLTFLEIPSFETGIEQIKDAVREGVGVIALCSTWLSYPGGADAVRQAAAALRKLAPGVPIIVGGVGARKGAYARKVLAEGTLADTSLDTLASHYLLMDCARDLDIDAIAISEGSEYALVDIAGAVRAGKDFRQLPNLAIPTPGGYVFTPEQPVASDVEGEMVDWRNHPDRVQFAEAPIRTGVGCPFRCQFCDFSSLYGCSIRSPESIVKELRTLAEIMPEPRHVIFTDDNLGLTSKKLRELALAVKKANLGISWRAFLRADSIDAEVAELLRESGCRECILGIESGSAEILKNMDKKLSPERTMQAVQCLDAEGIRSQGTFVVGFPGETNKTIQETADMLSAFPSGPQARALHRYYLFRFQVLPLIPAATRRSREKWSLKGIGENWSHITMNSEEAGSAMRELFLSVRGATHVYPELLPGAWTTGQTREVLECRDECQKASLRQDTSPARFDELLATVRRADGGDIPSLASPSNS